MLLGILSSSRDGAMEALIMEPTELDGALRGMHCTRATL